MHTVYGAVTLFVQYLVVCAALIRLTGFRKCTCKLFIVLLAVWISDDDVCRITEGLSELERAHAPRRAHTSVLSAVFHKFVIPIISRRPLTHPRVLAVPIN